MLGNWFRLVRLLKWQYVKMVSYFSPFLSHIHQNTIMRDEHIVSMQSVMQLLPTRGPVVLLQRLEEQFPEWSKIMLCAMCWEKNYIVLSWGFVWLKQNVFKESYSTFHFLWSQILRMISYICIVNVICTCSSISVTIFSMLVMIGHVRGIRHMYWYAVPTSEDFLKVHII